MKEETQLVLDPKDWEIIHLLRAGVISNSAIARKLDVSEGMIRKRIKRLRDLGIVSLRGLINTEMLHNNQVVWLGMNLSESRLLDNKAREITELPQVLSVSVVSGRYDLIVEVLVDAHRGLFNFLTQVLPNIDGIVKTESFVTLKTYAKHV